MKCDASEDVPANRSSASTLGAMVGARYGRGFLRRLFATVAGSIGA